jgi:hypothetical protein
MEDEAPMKYLLCEHWGGKFHNAQKSAAAGDDLMCWAAAASNVLAWTKWGMPSGQTFKTEDDIFKYYQDHWLDQPGYPQKAWEWWFNGIEQPGVESPGAGFWPSYEFVSYYHFQQDRPNALPAIEEFLRIGYGVVLELLSQSGGHYITCWGFESDDQGNYAGIYVTDSDDSLGGMRYYTLTQHGWSYDGWWYFDYCKNSIQYLITDVHALDRCPAAPAAPSTLRIVK